MKKHSARAGLAMLTATALAVTLAACGGDEKDPASNSITKADPNAKVTITVGDFPSADQTERVKYVTNQVKEFQAKYPNITVKTDTAAYSPDTFAAALAGNTLPDVFGVPFTEPQGLIRNKQVTDITDALQQIGLAGKLNPQVMKNVTDDKGRVFAIPDWAYSVGLTYNRDIFKKAGLDPDTPPKTWDEVRQFSKQIHDKTGIPGYAMMAAGNGGGWSLTNLTYAFGGTIENPEGTKSTLAEGPAQKALEMVRGMQEDGSFHNNLLLDFSGNMAQEFAAGKFAMFLGGSSWYNNTVLNNGQKPEAYGQTIMPATASGNATMIGGVARVVKAGLSPEKVLASIRWVDFSLLKLKHEKEAAIADAKASLKDELAVGIPELSAFNADIAAQRQEWLAPYVNVPLKNFEPYVKGLPSQKLVMEPAGKAQDVYKLLDSLVQKVLGDRKSDIAALVADYDKKINNLLRR